MHPNLLHDYPDVIEMLGPSVEVKPSSDDGISVEVSTAIPLGSVQGGVWHNSYSGHGWTCPACQTWQTHYRDPEGAYIALRVHEWHHCTARKDSDVTDDLIDAAARRVASLRTAEDLERLGEQR